MSEYRIKTPYGNIKFRCERNMGNCGISIIKGVKFHLDMGQTKDDLYKYFHDEILFGDKDINSDPNIDGWNYTNIRRNNGDWVVHKFILSDRTNRNREKTSIYDFCKHVEALEGTVVFNPNSGNNIQVFELDRPLTQKEKESIEPRGVY